METDVSAAVALFRSLADPARLAILRHLTLGEHRVVDLTAHLGLAQSTTSAHLACLRDCGLVSVRTVGRSSMYALAVEPELMEVLASAERLLAATGDAVTLCPTNLGRSTGSHPVSPATVTPTTTAAGRLPAGTAADWSPSWALNAGVLVLQVIGGLVVRLARPAGRRRPHADRLDRPGDRPGRRLPGRPPRHRRAEPSACSGSRSWPR